MEAFAQQDIAGQLARLAETLAGSEQLQRTTRGQLKVALRHAAAAACMPLLKKLYDGIVHDGIGLLACSCEVVRLVGWLLKRTRSFCAGAGVENGGPARPDPEPRGDAGTGVARDVQQMSRLCGSRGVETHTIAPCMSKCGFFDVP